MDTLTHALLLHRDIGLVRHIRSSSSVFVLAADIKYLQWIEQNEQIEQS